VAGEALNGLHRPREAIALLDGWAMKSVDWFVSQQATLAASFAATKDVPRLGEVRALMLRDFPDSADTWRVAGRFAELQGNLSEARAWYERIAREKLTGNEQALRIAGILTREGNAEAAIPVIEAYLKSRPWDVEAQHMLGRALAAAGRTALAATVYAKVIGLDADNVEALKEWADMLARLGRDSDAKSKLELVNAAERRLAVPLDIPEFRRSENRHAGQ
jgi:tetratricopeptide (TPR) repeat protein